MRLCSSTIEPIGFKIPRVKVHFLTLIYCEYFNFNKLLYCTCPVFSIGHNFAYYLKVFDFVVFFFHFFRPTIFKMIYSVILLLHGRLALELENGLMELMAPLRLLALNQKE